MTPTTNNPKASNENRSARPLTNRPSQSKTPSVNGLGRSPSLRGNLQRPARAGTNRSSPQTSLSSNITLASDDTSEDDIRAANLVLLEELKIRVQKAETASEEYQRQLNLLQARLDESQQAHSQLEDHLHAKVERVEELEMERAETARHKREVQALYESERTAILKDKEEQAVREEELQLVIQRLKENLAQKETKTNREDGREESQASVDQFAPPSSIQRNISEDYSKATIQKDRIIESLRLELAEAQIKIMEMDSMGGGNAHKLEKKLMEIKIENARLTEDNESFQLLLSEKTLNGEFGKTEAMQISSVTGSLAEELGSEELENAEGRSEAFRRLEVEVKSLKEQNKALAVYIEKIIGRLLMHKDFDNIFDKNPDLLSGAPRPQSASTDKELPPPPPPKDNEGGFLQRAKSVVAGSRGRPRPTSQIQQALPPAPSGPTEDPARASNVPLGRSSPVRNSSHQRTKSDIPNVTPLVNQMYRGPPSVGAPGSLSSPGLTPTSTTTRTSFFSPSTSIASPNATPRAPSGSRSSHHEANPSSSSNSTFSDKSGSLDSPPRNTAPNNYTGAVMTQSRLRPLRLVQENTDAETSAKRDEELAAAAAKRKANRASWIPGWMAQRAPSGDPS